MSGLEGEEEKEEDPQPFTYICYLGREMMKAGILEEMVEDTMSGLEGEEEEEDAAAQAEVDRIMFELTAGALGTAPDALKGMYFKNFYFILIGCS